MVVFFLVVVLALGFFRVVDCLAFTGGVAVVSSFFFFTIFVDDGLGEDREDLFLSCTIFFVFVSLKSFNPNIFASPSFRNIYLIYHI